MTPAEEEDERQFREHEADASHHIGKVNTRYRRIFEQGGSALVTLPFEWVRGLRECPDLDQHTVEVTWDDVSIEIRPIKLNYLGLKAEGSD
jgi:hypothetical protein